MAEKKLKGLEGLLGGSKRMQEVNNNLEQGNGQERSETPSSEAAGRFVIHGDNTEPEFDIKTLGSLEEQYSFLVEAAIQYKLQQGWNEVNPDIYNKAREAVLKMYNVSPEYFLTLKAAHEAKNLREFQGEKRRPGRPKSGEDTIKATFVADRTIYLKTQYIARSNGKMLKDIIGYALSQFVMQYEAKNGQIELPSAGESIEELIK